MTKLIKHLLKLGLGGEKEFTFEDRLVIAYMLYGCIICFLSIFLNFWMNLGWVNIIIVSTFAVFLFILYVLGRCYKKIMPVKIALSLGTLLFCNFYWYTNYGSQGSATYIFLVYFFIMIFIWDKFQIYLVALFVFINIVILFILEYSMPGLIPRYPTEATRVMDSYITLMIVLGFFAILIITVRNNYVKQTFMAQRSDKLKTAFLANMSHEIRTPLNALIGFSQLLIERDLPKDKKERYSQLITDNGDYLMKLISDILDVSMIESGQLKIVKSKCNLNNLLKHIFSVHNEVLNAKTADKVELKLEIPSQTVYAEVDEMRLKQIIFNLIGNAIKYTPKGYIKFGFTTSDNEILFFVEDTGYGIKEEFQPEVFNRFVRHEEVYEVKNTRGSGIGLSLSKELVNILGGKIWFNSKYNEGTTFYFS